MFLICLILDIRWVPLGNSSGKGTWAHDTQGNHVGRINTDHGYIIGKIDDSDGHFYAAYRQEVFTDTTTHQYEVNHERDRSQIRHVSHFVYTDVFELCRFGDEFTHIVWVA